MEEEMASVSGIRVMKGRLRAASWLLLILGVLLEAVHQAKLAFSPAVGYEIVRLSESGLASLSEYGLIFTYVSAHLASGALIGMSIVLLYAVKASGDDGIKPSGWILLGIVLGAAAVLPAVFPAAGILMLGKPLYSIMAFVLLMLLGAGAGLSATAR
ncbi:MAG: hypothetical protein SOU51_03350 [Collinsella sp.]|nr:hypothetical protein [Collinsella sp.]